MRVYSFMYPATRVLACVVNWAITPFFDVTHCFVKYFLLNLRVYFIHSNVYGKGRMPGYVVLIIKTHAL